MQYLGGKVRLSRHIAAVIASHIPIGGTYVEPFCGGCAVAVKIHQLRPDVKIICADIHPYLIALLKGVSDGTFTPPESLSEEEYKYLRAHKDENPALAGFAGFCASYAGIWFHGYARNARGRPAAPEKHYRPRAIIAHDNLIRDFYRTPIQFIHTDYRALEIPEGAVIYCDPPYKDTSGYDGTPHFDNDSYIIWLNELAETHTVFMSEYQQNVEANANIVWQKTYLGNMRMGDQKKRPLRTDVLIRV